MLLPFMFGRVHLSVTIKWPWLGSFQLSMLTSLNEMPGNISGLQWGREEGLDKMLQRFSETQIWSYYPHLRPSCQTCLSLFLSFLSLKGFSYMWAGAEMVTSRLSQWFRPLTGGKRLAHLLDVNAYLYLTSVTHRVKNEVNKLDLLTTDWAQCLNCVLHLGLMFCHLILKSNRIKIDRLMRFLIPWTQNTLMNYMCQILFYFCLCHWKQYVPTDRWTDRFQFHPFSNKETLP